MGMAKCVILLESAKIIMFTHEHERNGKHVCIILLLH